jgi:arylsulfatase A-like enzyme
VLAGVLLCAALGPLAAARVDTLGLERNAWTALAGPIALHNGPSMAVRDWRARDAARGSAEDLTRLRGALAGRNVVLVSLESTAARYLGIYGAAPDIAPNLSALARSGLVFENAYAVYPESIKGLFSILCSATPGFETNAVSYGGVPCRSAAAVLRDRGYRTALFHSGRFAYLGMNGVIRNRGYDLLADAGDIGGRRDSSFGIDEPSTVARILDWIDAQRDRPFFVTYLPIAGHHPYESPEGGPFPDDDEFGRYRNAVHDGDAALGALRRGLEARGLDRRTAWVVLGDHGEAFGQHPGNYGHTFQLYDENVRVPFVIAAPGLFTQATRVRRVVSLLDTAPTLLDLIGLPIPASYEGSSMLDGRARMALFFTDYSLPLVGLRDGPRKFIHDLRSGRSRMFDVELDPDETIDLSARYASDARRYADALAAWVAARQEAVNGVVARCHTTPACE